GGASNLSRKFSQNQAVGAVGLLSYPESYPCQWRAGVGLVDIRWAHLGDRGASVLEFTCRRIRRTGWAAPHALSKLQRLSTPAENCTFLAVENCTLKLRGRPSVRRGSPSFFVVRRSQKQWSLRLAARPSADPHALACGSCCRGY